MLLVDAGASAFLLDFYLEESFSTVLSVGAGDCAFSAGGSLADATLPCSFFTTLFVGAGDGPRATGSSWTLVGTVLVALFVSAGAGAFAAGGCLVAVLEVLLVGESFFTALRLTAEDGPFAAGGAGDGLVAAGASLVSVFEGTFLGESFLGFLVSAFAGAGDGPSAVGGCSFLVDAALLGSFVTVLRVGAGVVLDAGLEVGATAGVFVGNGVMVGAGFTCVVVVGGAVVPPAHAGIFGTPI